MIIIPAIDLSGGVVAVRRDGLAPTSGAGEDPLEAARTLVARGARMLHVVDLDGARTGEYVNIGLVGAIAAAAGVPVQLGGSLTEVGLAREALAHGVARVVFGSALLGAPERLAAVASLDERALLALEIEEDRLRPRGGDTILAENVRGAHALTLARAAAESGVRRFYVVDVESDGRLGGPPMAFLARLVEELRDIMPELHVGGGVRNLVDVRDLAAFGVRTVVIGRAIMEGLLDLGEAQRVADAAPR